MRSVVSALRSRQLQPDVSASCCKRPASPFRESRARQFREFVRLSCSRSFHPVRTCKMGVDPLSVVVIPRLKVHGHERAFGGYATRDAQITTAIRTLRA